MARFQFLTGFQLGLQQYLDAALQIEALSDLKVALDLDRPRRDVQARAAGHHDIEGDRGEDDD